MQTAASNVNQPLELLGCLPTFGSCIGFQFYFQNLLQHMHGRIPYVFDCLVVHNLLLPKELHAHLELHDYLESTHRLSLLKKLAIHGLFLICIWSFSNKQYKILQQNNVKKYPFSMWCWDSNPQPSDCESHLLTPRPGLLAYLATLLQRTL